MWLFARMRRAGSVADALGRTARYGRCSRRERQTISQASTLVEVAAGAVLARDDHLARRFVIVLTGAATISGAAGWESALLAGDHFGDAALLEVDRNPVTVVAATAMTLAVVDPTEFHALLERSPAVARAVLNGLAERLRGRIAA